MALIDTNGVPLAVVQEFEDSLEAEATAYEDALRRELAGEPAPTTRRLDRVRLANVIALFDPDQPRDESGRWTDTGGGGAASQPWSERVAEATIQHRLEEGKPQQQNLPIGGHGKPSSLDRPTPVDITGTGGPLGGDHVNSVYHVTLPDHSTAIFKPVAGEEFYLTLDKTALIRNQIDPDKSDASLAEREVLASRIDRALGLNVLPEAFLADAAQDDPNPSYPEVGGKGAMLQFVPNDGPDWSRVYSPDNVERAAQIGILDAIIGNLDRHPENFLIDKQGKLWGIDHGYAFGDSPPFSNLRSWALGNIRDGDLSIEKQHALAKKIEALDWNDLLADAHLSPDERETLLDRITDVRVALSKGRASHIADRFQVRNELPREGPPASGRRPDTSWHPPSS